MELILISESKLKIMLSAPDMARYELEAARMDCADAHTRAAFRHIFDDVRAEVGFDTAGSPLFVQLYASPEGGCEIFVTKLEGQEPSAAGDPSAPPLPSHGEKKLLERVLRADPAPRLPEPAPGEDPAAAYRFSALEDLLAVCRRLAGDGGRWRCRVYLEESPTGDIWYLIPRSSCALPCFLAEYGAPLPAAGLGDYLAEHGRMIGGEDAVEVMGKL